MLLEQVNSLAGVAEAGRGAICDAISAIPGIKLRSAYQGTFKSGRARAKLRLSTTDDLLMMCGPIRAIGLPQALESSHRLPANLRYALTGEQMVLVANLLTQPPDQLGDSFCEFGRGMAMAFEANPQRGDCAASAGIEPGPEPTTQQLVEAFGPLGWDSQSVVELPAGWELRPTVANRPLAVKLTVDGDALRLHHVVITGLVQTGGAAAALYDQALRLNHRLRYARLVSTAGQIVAEARLRPGQFSGSNLAGAAQAVACAAHHARSLLQILNTDARVAACYAATLRCDTNCDESIVDSSLALS